MTEAIQAELPGFEFEEILLDSLDIALPQTSVISRLISQQGRRWKQIDLEECSGEMLPMLLTVIFMSSVSRIKISCTWDEPLSEEAFKAIALGIVSNKNLEKLTIKASMSTIHTSWLARGVEQAAGLKSLLLWDCRIDNDSVDGDSPFARGVSLAKTLEEFGMVACMVEQEQFERVLNAVGRNECIRTLDLRGCSLSNLPLISSFLAQDTSLVSLDISFQTGNAESMNLELLRDALGQHPTLEKLHLCRNHINDEALDLLLDSVAMSSSLRLLNLSLNSITSVEGISHRLVDGCLPIRWVLLDGNPIKDPSPLLSVLQSSNTTLETCMIPQHFEKEQELIHFYTRLNRGGRRVVLGGEHLQPALWPVLLQRANQLIFDNCATATGRADVLYHLLHGQILFSIAELNEVST